LRSFLSQTFSAFAFLRDRPASRRSSSVTNILTNDRASADGTDWCRLRQQLGDIAIRRQVRAR
jgi:hypothetical protein